MEPIVIIAILLLLGRGKKTEETSSAGSRGVSPSVTPPLPSETTASGLYQTTNTSSTMTPTFLDSPGTGGTQGNFGGTYRGVQVIGRRGGSGRVDKGAMVRPPSGPPTPVYRAPTPPRAAPQAPPTIPSQSGTPVPPAPKTVVPISRAADVPSVADTVASGGVPEFCNRSYTPLLLSQCPGSQTEPAKRMGVPPAGTLVVTGPVLGAQRSNAWPSCPDARGQGGVYYLTAGSDEWNAICPPATSAPEI